MFAAFCQQEQKNMTTQQQHFACRLRNISQLVTVSSGKKFKIGAAMNQV